MGDFLELINTRRSVRDFSGAPIAEAGVERMLRAAMAAPSAVNVRPWAFIVVNKRELLSELRESLPYAKMLDKAALAIIVCGLPGKDERFAKDYWVMDCSAATENILLAAHALGYGAVWTAVFPEKERIDAARRICRIPPAAIPLNAIAVGVPAQAAGAAADRYDQGSVHWDYY